LRHGHDDDNNEPNLYDIIDQHNVHDINNRHNVGDVHYHHHDGAVDPGPRRQHG
jgi:hypothetical protein